MQTPTAHGATVWWLAVGRLPATTATRMLAPLLGVIAAGVGVSLVTAGVLVAMFEAVGFAAPLAGWLVDRHGARRTMLTSLAAFVVAGLAAASSRGVASFAVALVALGIAAMVYESASTAWVAGVSHYDDRAAWLGRLDTAWAGGLLVGVPIVAALTLWSWRAAYLAVAALAMAAWWSLRTRITADPIMAASNLAVPAARGSGGRWDWATIRGGLGLFAAFGLLAGASQLVIVVYGVWLEERFGFRTSLIGAVGFLFGVGDLVAAMATMRFTDRIGKLRAATLGAAVLATAGLLLVVTGHHPATGIPTILLLLVGYEFALLSTKPVLTEIDPDNRGLGIGIGFGTAAACRGLAAIAGTTLYSAFGLTAVAIASSMTAGVALLVLLAGIRRRIGLRPG